MSNVVTTVAGIVLLLSSVPGHATGKGEHNLTSSLIYHGETPAGSLLTLSVANVDPKRDAHGRPSCEKVEATFRVLGTLAPTSRENAEVRTLEVLHRSRFVLAPGEVQPFQFRQASSSTETVIFQTLMSERAARCLLHSSVSVHNAAGDLVSVVPVDPIIGFHLILDTGSPGRCCDCAPVCECGLCPD